MRSYETLIRWKSVWNLWFFLWTGLCPEKPRNHLLMINQTENGFAGLPAFQWIQQKGKSGRNQGFFS